MLNTSSLPRVAVVLVRARNPNNIGAVARAMHDFGFSDLRIVNDFSMPLEGARSAVDASTVLHAASAHSSVAEAVADCTLVIGTTAVGERDLNHPLLALDEAPPKVHDALASNSERKIALLFGSEKTGLSNDELSHCNFLLTIPMFQACRQPASFDESRTGCRCMSLRACSWTAALANGKTCGGCFRRGAGTPHKSAS